jgi:SAM-dependent methyltransferase
MLTKILLFITFLFLLSLAWSGKSFAPWVPTKKKDVKRIMTLAGLAPGEVWIELGCGDGRTTLAAAKTGARASGIEMAVPMYLIAKLRALQTTANIYFGNLYNFDLTKADVIYFFGMPDAITRKLKIKLEAELKPGTRVISYAFPIKGWGPTKTDKPTKNDIDIYLYQLR